MLLYIRGQGEPLDTQVDLRDRSLAVCGAPSTILHLGHNVAVLRRSPATVKHQDRHHAVVLTKLFPEALLDRSPGSVIELNVCQELGDAGVTVLGSVEPGRRTTTSSTLRQRFRFGLRGYIENTLPSRCYASP